ncbi:MAG: M23 family metallopeptidase, partial [Calditrichia bacterium]
MLLNRFVFLLLLIVSLSVNGGNYAWPTDASKLITSSFGEFRPRHFHAAIDIKTWGRTGYKIFAIDDGYIFRIRVSAHGYGKAIYLKLNDGNIVVYGHLNGFIPEIENFTDSLRLTRQSNTLDEYLKRSQFPVKKGQLLGYSGETGIGVPHLHFEIRNASNHPINPLKYYRSEIKDKIPPTAQALAIIPQQATTLINFKPDTFFIKLPHQQRYVLPEPVYLSGKASLGLKSFDRTNGARNVFGVYRGRLIVNDSLIYEVRYDHFSYAKTRLVELDKNYSLWRKRRGVYHNFFVHPMNTLPFYRKTPPGGGILSGNYLKEGINHVRLELLDFAGNWCEVEIPLIYHRRNKLKILDISRMGDSLRVGLKSDHPVEKLEITREENSPGKITYRLKKLSNSPNSTVFSVTIPFQPNLNNGVIRLQAYSASGAPTLPLFLPVQRQTSQPVSNSATPKLNFKLAGKWLAIKAEESAKLNLPVNSPEAFVYHYTHNKTYIVLPVDSFLTGEYSSLQYKSLKREIERWTLITPTKHSRVSSPGGMLSVDFPVEAVYDSFYCKIDELTISKQYATDLKKYPILTPIYRVQPFDVPINHGAVLNISLPDSLNGENGLGVYYWDNKKGWLFIPSNYDAVRGSYQTRVTSLEKFTIIKDTIPPRIIPLNLARPGPTLVRKNPIRIKITDEMSGLYKQKQINVFIDDKWSLFEFDPEEDV